MKVLFISSAFDLENAIEVAIDQIKSLGLESPEKTLFGGFWEDLRDRLRNSTDSTARKEHVYLTNDGLVVYRQEIVLRINPDGFDGAKITVTTYKHLISGVN